MKKNGLGFKILSGVLGLGLVGSTAATASLSKQNKDLQDDNARLEQLYNEKSVSYENLQSKLGTLNTTIDSLVTKNENLSGIEKQNIEFITQITLLNKTINELENAVFMYEHDSSIDKKTIDNYKLQIDKLSNDLTTLESEYFDLNLNYVDEHNKNIDLTVQNNVLKSEFDRLTKTANFYVEQLTELTKENSQLQDALAHCEINMKILQKNNENLQKNYNELWDKNHDLKSENSGLKSENELLKGQLEASPVKLLQAGLKEIEVMIFDNDYPLSNEEDKYVSRLLSDCVYFVQVMYESRQITEKQFNEIYGNLRDIVNEYAYQRIEKGLKNYRDDECNLKMNMISMNGSSDKTSIAYSGNQAYSYGTMMGVDYYAVIEDGIAHSSENGEYIEYEITSSTDVRNENLNGLLSELKTVLEDKSVYFGYGINSDCVWLMRDTENGTTDIINYAFDGNGQLETYYNYDSNIEVDFSDISDEEFASYYGEVGVKVQEAKQKQTESQNSK